MAFGWRYAYAGWTLTNARSPTAMDERASVRPRTQTSPGKIVSSFDPGVDDDEATREARGRRVVSPDASVVPVPDAASDPSSRMSLCGEPHPPATSARVERRRRAPLGTPSCNSPSSLPSSLGASTASGLTAYATRWNVTSCP